jgi:hypothetical protein
MGTATDNSHELRDFVDTHHLRNRYSVIHFNAIISITTAKNKVTNLAAEVMVNFDEYGQLSILRAETELNPYLYPTVFDAMWQNMQHIDGEYLLVTDTHRKNADIGKYSAKIHPLKRLRD